MNTRELGDDRGAPREISVLQGERGRAGSLFRAKPALLVVKGIYIRSLPKYISMKDKGTPKGKSRKQESSEGAAGEATDAKAAPMKNAPLTAKEKIAANQKSKRRK